jgi:hypothetical protein
VTGPQPVVLVVGPPRAGVDGVIEALRGRLPGRVVVGVDRSARPAVRDVVVADVVVPDVVVPDVVVAVVSAAAPMVRSDWDLIERAAAGTEVIGVVSKRDAHRSWRGVLDADRMLAARWSECRRGMAWVAVAAAPDLGEPRVDDLVDALRNPRRGRREAPGRPSTAPEASRTDAVVRRAAVARLRLELLRTVHDRAAALRSDLRDVVAGVAVGGSDGFEALVRHEARRFEADLDDRITRALQATAAELGRDGPALTASPGRRFEEPDDLRRVPSSSRRLEARLMAVLGVGFGLGVALASSRLLAGLAPGPSIVGTVGGAVVGLAVVVWVVRVRGLLHERALLDRWVVEVVAGLRWHGDAVVAERLIEAEARWSAARPDGTPGTLAARDGYGLGVVTEQYEW